MPDEKEFPRGLFVSAPRANAPDFVKGRISIRVVEFLEWLSKKDGEEWLRLDIKEGFSVDDKGNPKWYSQVDNWKPSDRNATPSNQNLPESKEEESDGIPF